MNGARTLLTVAIALCVGTVAAGVRYQFRGALEATAYATYAWQPGTPSRFPRVQEEIVAAADRQLAKLGLRRVETDADLHAATYAMADRHEMKDLEEPDYWEFWTGTGVDARKVGLGTLVIDLVDARSGERIWRGVASGSVAEKPAKIERKIGRIVERMLARSTDPAR